ncbi:MAG: TetR family transcriptional regulator [Rhodoferax sp.]|uniref:TetR/AcrR family transcriptional regulator n=1 Tax=Rhodoferax sp. TaxID=50421 RepID=UPI0026245CD5|nr:TetR family transcriptional regulator [Rhodoferax sp.]MDD2880686.1 TetR family transcriptional regulator [Rhodoferax sp.]
MEVLDTPVKQRTEVRQASLVEAALLLAAQRSPASITTGDLARAVGITQGAVFRHFASKEAIWLAVLDWVTETLLTQLQAAADAANLASDGHSKGQKPLAPLHAVFLAHVDFVVAHPGVPRVMFQELQSPGDTALKSSVRGLMQRYRQLLMQLLTQAQDDQTIASDTDLPSAAVLFIGSVQGLVMQALMSGNVSAMTKQAPGVFAIYQRGLQAAPNDSQGTP